MILNRHTEFHRSSFSNFSILGKYLGNKVLIAFSNKLLATKSAPSCSPSYTNSTLPVIAGIIPVKSDKRITVSVISSN